ncbi:MAG: MarR family transcriptional regulator, partial [Pseudomonadota bacterium]
MSEDNIMAAEVFGFFTEIGIINQLSTAILAKSLPEGVHPSHFSILNHLVRMGDGKPPVRIASAMQVTKNTMTHSLKVLQDRGYIMVAPDPADGRGKLVYLTDSGRRFRDQAIV